MNTNDDTLSFTITIGDAPSCLCECCPLTDCPRRAPPAPSTYFRYASPWDWPAYYTVPPNYIASPPVYWPQELGTAWPS